MYGFPFCATVPRALPLSFSPGFSTLPKSDFVVRENEIMTLLLVGWCETMVIY